MMNTTRLVNGRQRHIADENVFAVLSGNRSLVSSNENARPGGEAVAAAT